MSASAAPCVTNELGRQDHEQIGNSRFAKFNTFVDHGQAELRRAGCGSAAALWLTLWRFEHVATDSVRVSVRTLADCFGTDTKAIRRMLTQLEEHGYLRTLEEGSRGRGMCAVYELISCPEKGAPCLLSITEKGGTVPPIRSEKEGTMPPLLSGEKEGTMPPIDWEKGARRPQKEGTMPPLQKEKDRQTDCAPENKPTFDPQREEQDARKLFEKRWIESGLRKFSLLSLSLRYALATRLRDPWWAEHYPAALTKAGQIPFLRNGAGRHKGPLDVSEFLRDDDICRQIIDGKFDPHDAKSAGEGLRPPPDFGRQPPPQTAARKT